MRTPVYRWRHLTLLISILLIIISAPLVAPLRDGAVILNVIGAAVLLSGAYAVSERKYVFATAIILSVASVIATWLLSAFPARWSVIVSHTCLIILLGFFAITILGYVMRSGWVTSDKIFAAICAYLLIGYAWAFGYALLDELQPGAFAASTEVPRGDYISRLMEMRYFSFVTLTTVGYGDIVPRSPGARTMVILEAILGQFYLVALIGRLVGLHIVHGTRSSSREGEQSR
jgi:voltage-gated potassium channel